MLARFHEDTATLRRELVGYGLMGREGGGGVLARITKSSGSTCPNRGQLPDER
jgi:hypothetical protein